MGLFDQIKALIDETQRRQGIQFKPPKGVADYQYKDVKREKAEQKQSSQPSSQMADRFMPQATVNPGASSPYASNAGAYGPAGTYGEGVVGAGSPGGAGASGGEGAGAGGPWAAVLAAIAGQMLATKYTDRHAGGGDYSNNSEGHRTGNAFSMDFFTEPWSAYALQSVGSKKLTPGEKTDAAVDRFREGKGSLMDVLRSAPGTAAQWFDPIGSTLYTYGSDKLGPIGDYASKIVFPVHWLSDLFGG